MELNNFKSKVNRVTEIDEGNDKDVNQRETLWENIKQHSNNERNF